MDMGVMPIPNGFRKKEEVNNKEPKYELACNFCENCGLVQLSSVVNPEVMFKDYLYIPSTSKVMMNNFTSLVYQAHLDKNLDDSSVVVDIGSNDGTLLRGFKDGGTKVLGVEPTNVAKVANKRGIPTIQEFFNSETAGRLVKKYGQAKVITAANVFAHIDNVYDLLAGIKKLLK